MAESDRNQRSRMTPKDLGGLALFCGGMILTNFGCNNLSPAEYRLSLRSHECVLEQTNVDPPKYSPRSSSDLCQKIDQGMSKADLLAELDTEANAERPWGAVKIAGGLAIAGGALGLMFWPWIIPQRRLQEDSQ